MAANLELAPTGDLLFLVGKCKEQARVRVNSDIMKNASRVFRTMLGPNFNEGQRLLATNKDGQPTEVKLPEDIPKAFISICRVLHWCEEAPSTSAELLDIAFLAEKYDLTRPLSHASDDWIQILRSSTDPKVLWQLLVAACLMGTPQSFEQVSQQLTLNYDGPFWDLAGTTPAFDLSFKLACKLRHRLSDPVY